MIDGINGACYPLVTALDHVQEELGTYPAESPSSGTRLPESECYYVPIMTLRPSSAGPKKVRAPRLYLLRQRGRSLVRPSSQSPSVGFRPVIGRAYPLLAGVLVALNESLSIAIRYSSR